MSTVAPSGAENDLELAHVLFVDVVGYSKTLVDEQREMLRELNAIVRGTEQFRKADAQQKLICLPTGDGMALAFFTTPEAPVRCAIEMARALKNHPQIELRMGVHTGPVHTVADVNERANVAGAGINMAQRVMDCGDAGHILLSQRVAEDLGHSREWSPLLHDLGECEVKHGARVHLFNFHGEDLGNAAIPARVKQAAEIRKKKSRPKLLSVSAIALLVLGVVIYNQLTRSNREVSSSSVAAPEKSIAVLPFENLSEDKSNAYFSEGIQDEILTRLAKIAALKVISRTSTQKYKSAPDNLREVGRQLGVANILEGSVQKVANAVHVNVQLIRAATDEHLWAESYTRKLDDIFEVEGEVAGTIADQLKAKLSGSEKQELVAKPTTNSEAYDAYLHGLALFERADSLTTDLKSAVTSFETAVRLDPNFGLGWARLSHAHSSVFFADDSSTARREAARAALDNAVRLEPDLLETQLAEAYYRYFVERDYDRARQVFEQVRLRSRNNSEAPRALALIARRQGSWEESLARFSEAIELDPRNLRALLWMADTYTALRQFPAALKLIDRVLDIAPADNGAIGRKVSIYQGLGKLEEADAVLAQTGSDANDGQLSGTVINQWALQHRYPAAIALLQSSLAKLSPSQTFERGHSLFCLGELQRFAGDATNAHESYLQSREIFEAGWRSQPDNPDYLSYLALVDAGLREREAAMREARRAIELMPSSKDALKGPAYELTLALVLARFGEKDAAIAAVQHLLIVPYFGNDAPVLTPALLRLDPNWDNLRDDPRFQKLIASLEPSQR